MPSGRNEIYFILKGLLFHRPIKIYRSAHRMSIPLKKMTLFVNVPPLEETGHAVSVGSRFG